MNGSSVSKDSTESFLYDEPIVNLDNEIPHRVPNGFNEIEDDECTIVEPKNSQQTNLYNNSNKESKNLLKNYMKGVAVVIVEDDKDNDCTIIENQTDSEKAVKCVAKCHYNVNDPEKSLERSSQSCIKQSNLIEESIDDAIVLDEDSERENDCIIIDTTIVSQENQSMNNIPSQKNKVKLYDEIYKRDKVLAELIEKCLNMENSMGMIRIINRTLIPIYNNTSDDFKKSLCYQNILTKTVTRLEIEPNKKFSHLKEFCEVMKADLVSAPYCFRKKQEKKAKIMNEKKRVQLTTLKRKLNGQFTSNKTKSSDGSIPMKKTKLDVIDLDEDDDIIIEKSETSIHINGVDCQDVETTSTQHKNHVEKTNNDNVAINEKSNINNDINEHSKENNETNEHTKENDETNEHTKENNETNEHTKENDETSKHSKTDNDAILVGNINDGINEHSKENDKTDEDDVILVEDLNHNNNKENCMVTSDQLKNTNICSVPYVGCAKKTHKMYNNESDTDIHNAEETNQLLNPREIQFSNSLSNTPEYEIKREIDEIENKIKSYKQLIEDLEIKEVDWDSNDSNSPYVLSELYKTKVVTLYKKLCKLTGTDSVKRHKVRLKVVEGRHAGPMRILEQFINDNIDKNGNPRFPDMHDVIKCVHEANVMYQIGWSEKQIEKEAQGLFIHYGRTVQKRRQKREWRDLMYLVKKEAIDPADEDPTLQARLAENAKLAVKNEKDLIDRYAQLEYSNADSVARMSIESPENENDSDNSETSTTCNETVPNNSTVLDNATVPNNTSVINNKTVANNTSVLNNINVPNNTLVLDGGTVLNNTSVLNNINVPNNTLVLDGRSVLNNINVPNNTLVLDGRTVLNNTLLPDGRSVLNNINVPSNVEDSVLSNTIVHDNSISPNNTNKESSSTTDSVILYDPCNAVYQEIIVPSFVATNQIRYIVVDENMKTVGVITKPQQNYGAKGSTEPSKNKIIDKDACEELNYSKTLDSAVQQDSKENEELEINNQIDIKPNLEVMGTADTENNEVTTDLGANTAIDIINEQNLDGSNNENSVDIDIKPNISDIDVTKTCIQYNKMSTNSNAVTTRNLTGCKDLLETYAVSSSTEVSTNTCKLVNYTGSSEPEGITCGLLNDTGPKTIHNSCELVNDTGFSIEGKTCEIVNDSRSIEARGISCEVVNDLGSLTTDINVVVKKEKLDIPRMLEALGDDYTVSIIDIEDPFEIIDISDSSDSEDEL